MTIYRDMSLLHPKFRGRADALAEYLISAYETNLTKTRFHVFETFRDPARQSELLTKRVTKAGPFESAHQFGLAVDFVPYLSPDEALALGNRIGERVLPDWNWHSSHEYSFLSAAAKKFDLSVPIAWDPCHVQHPKWSEILFDFKQNLK